MPMEKTMKKTLMALPFLSLLLLMIVNCTEAFASQASSQTVGSASVNAAGYQQVNACEQAAPGFAHCLAIIVKAKGMHANVARNKPEGLTPSDLQAAYKLPSARAGKGQTIAIIDAYDDPNAEKDLAVYRATFGLPACTTANGCFKKVGQNGGKNYPGANGNWAGEIALDLDMVSAIAPNSHILLVESTSAAFGDLGRAVDMAVRLGATEVSNSYGGKETAKDARDMARYYNHPGVVITASSGDSGYGVQFPAAYNTVVAVGGTTLSRAKNARGWTESAWSGSGSGCSQYISKPTWQKDTGCQQRTVADVSAVADPDKGVAVYNSSENS